MKAILFLAMTVSSYAAHAVTCDDLSGVYQSTDKGIGTRIYEIQQNNCEIKMKLNNAGADVDPDILRADNAAYDRSQANFSNDGHVINPFLPATSNSTRIERAFFLGGVLYINNLDAYSIPLSQCKEQLGVQSNCWFRQHVFAKDSAQSLLETQNGYLYGDHGHIPIFIHYKKIK